MKKSTNTKDDKIVYNLERGRSQETSLSGGKIPLGMINIVAADFNPLNNKNRHK
ncbi:hypothetical protein [Flavobacterium collinsii]|uniref:hypothetical protein n=1 Tax=Flavobacterium collinsii TaxID=1114861 RepID=UPI0021DFD28F|nr:hypothetical protein [Flavobacterium collinsii]